MRLERHLEIQHAAYYFTEKTEMGETQLKGISSDGDSGTVELRIGVFLCHCGGNISDVVDVERVVVETGKLPDVVVSETQMFMCSDPGQLHIENAIKEHNLNRIIVAACSPTLHEMTFRRAIARAGLNPYLFEHVNIREHVSWVIKDRDAATRKAIRLISASAARVRHLEKLEKRRIPIHDAALVIGGGLAGLKAALDLAHRGINVTLAEKKDRLGGRYLKLDRIFPTNEKARDIIEPLIAEVVAHPRITVYTNTTLKDAKGSVGDFNTTIKYKDPGGGFEQTDVHSGVIIIAAGLTVYKPREGEYQFRTAPEVIDLLKLQQMLNPDGPTGGKLQVNGKPVQNVAFIHCVGSRQWPDVHLPQEDGRINDYCSRYCCSAIMRSAVEIKERFPDVNVFDFHEDIRTYSRGTEEFYTKASELGVLFIRFDPHQPPVVEQDPTREAPLVVRCVDRLTMNEEVEVPADLVVLGTGLMARDMTTLVDLFRCSRGQDRFLLEAHPKLRPVELASAGLFLAGSVQGPMDSTEASAGASAAASKASAMVVQGFVEMDPFIAKVDEDLCTGCQTCLNICPYDAINRDENNGAAVISEALCTGCGTCAATCPSSAIQQFGFNDAEITSEILALLGVLDAEEESVTVV